MNGRLSKVDMESRILRIKKGIDEHLWYPEWAVGSVAHLQPVQARLSRRRKVRARVGVLEGVRGTAGGGPTSVPGDERAWTRFIQCSPPRGRFARIRSPVGYDTAPWR